MLIVALYALALLLELAGLVLAGIGFRRTWLAHAHGEEFLGPAKAWVRDATRRAENTARRVFGLPPKPQTVELSPASVLVLAGDVRARVSFGSLPDPADAGAFAAAVRERLDRLHSMIQDNQDAVADEREAREKEDQKLRADLGSELARVEARTEHVAVGGIRLQFVGWLFLIGGVCLGSFVNIIDAWP